MESPYNPWTTSGVHKRKQRKVRDKAVPSLHISTYWLGADNTVIITKPDRDTVRSELIQMARTHGKIHLIHAPHSNLPEERYALSPLKLLSIPKDEAIYFYVETLCQPGDPDHKWVVCPGERDALLLIALTHMLNSCFMRSSIFQEQSCGFPRDRREFFAKLGGVGKIITIFILNLAPSQDSNDQNGINCSITEVGIPHAGLITKVLYNLMLDDFDRGFKQLYPSLSYYRYLGYCYVLFTLFSLQSEQQCEEEMNSILLELDLDGDITTILPGGGAHVTRDGRLIILSRDCGLHVVEQSTFFL
ncbi:hypothetical protein RDI58_030036 [Solanum bulbocastanum]|uniref:Uncharacterized protein n=1 Tax=Solanum bulbocastanum TaxID=147425 RepID=A0AAN8Y012_SOLBU